ncbi:MAG: multiheme c-type cytochrome [Desulfobacterales bacterium]|nr:multiheme c-type cytochrome [Desulfobacterales bacterium]MDH3876774.1 multiheme c-type cytochrome [Desulfobacterales bacterium]MDH4009966.1 multiheme c-type cytochrome [Desulfobacterales bacterium]
MQKITKKCVFGGLTVMVAILAAGFYLVTGAATAADEKRPAGTLRGRVTSTYGPVENARVRIIGEESFTLTDRQGRYELQTAHSPGDRVIVTAGKEGWFNNGQLANFSGHTRDIVLNPVYLADRADYRFISPVTCARCHVKLTRYYDQSKMAHTTSNPKVLNMYYGTDAFNRSGAGPGYRLDNPQSEGNCTTCHAPSVAGSIPASQDLQTVLRSPWTEWDGISCDYCHKVRKVIKDKTKPSQTTAVHERQTPTQGNSILVFGPYDDVIAPPMAASYNPVFDQGQFCSLCHSQSKKLESGKIWDSTKIYSSAEWKAFGLKDKTSIPIQTTYQEWKQWQDQLPAGDANKGKKCQDCHMSWRKEMLPYDNYVVDQNARHMWGNFRSPKNIRPHHFDGGTEIQLKTALALELEGETSGNKLSVNAYITNTNGGHWVPTGETMRSVMLLLKATDSNGKPLKMIKGSTLPDWTGKGNVKTGNYAGLPGAAFARVLGDDEGNLNVPFWKATRIVADTRIRPKKTITFKFEFLIEDPDDEPTAEASLIYRPAIRSLAEIKNWKVEDILITSSVW